MKALFSLFQRLGAWFLGLFPNNDEYTRGFDWAWECLTHAIDIDDVIHSLETYAGMDVYDGEEPAAFCKGIRAAIDAWGEQHESE